jgi:hypothetical protein
MKTPIPPSYKKDQDRRFYPSGKPMDSVRFVETGSPYSESSLTG